MANTHAHMEDSSFDRRKSDCMRTIHMIGNAHLDPIFLWPWQRGADEALATCRTACDILDAYPDAVFTRGEAWVYQQVKTLDPATFARMQGHIASGQWAVVNGWWVQPDVNLPTEEAILRSARIGQGWFRRHLGLKSVTVAYNVDSFGHGAYLPRMIRQAGQRYYVFTRPSQAQMKLPAGPFRWRSPDGHEVLAYRAWAYGWDASDLSANINNVLSQAVGLPPHGMCFYGVSDHGGGPTRGAVEWIAAHREYTSGVHLEYSSPDRFFAAIEPYRDQLPIIEGELQYMHIGCYAVNAGLKREMRTAEFAVVDTETLLGTLDRHATRAEKDEVTLAWEHIAFNGFHDVLAGTSPEEAMRAQVRQLGEAISRLERVEYTALRTHPALAAREQINGHRLHLVNRLARPWQGHAEGEIWFNYMPWEHHFEDEEGATVPVQSLEPSSVILGSLYGGHGIQRFLFPLSLAATEWKTLRIVRGTPEPPASDLAWEGGVLRNAHLQVTFCCEGIAGIEHDGRQRLAAPFGLACLDDQRDTWGDGSDHYEGSLRATANFTAPVLVEDGPLRATVRLDGMVGSSEARLFVSLYRIERAVHCRLAISYHETMSVLKAYLHPAGGITGHRDRVAGGWIDRPAGGRECPVHHASLLASMGVVFPDTFALDADNARCGLTLIRNNRHVVQFGNIPRETRPRMVEKPGTDEGPHNLRFSLLFDADDASAEAVLDVAQRPPHCWDDFRNIDRNYQYTEWFEKNQK